MAFEPVRLLLPLLGVGSLFAALEGLRPGDLAFFRVVMALANTAGMLGAFLLARRLGGTFAGGITALVMAALHPSYSVQTGRLYPDPVTGCLFVWSAWLYVEGSSTGARDGSGRHRALDGHGHLLTHKLTQKTQRHRERRERDSTAAAQESSVVTSCVSSRGHTPPPLALIRSGLFLSVLCVSVSLWLFIG